MLILENKILFIDEIENGIHYSLFDKMWEIILKISKELEDNDISFINLSRNQTDKIVAITLDSGMFRSEIAQNHEVRAW